MTDEQTTTAAAPRRNGGDLAVETLHALGARTVFGIPGQHITRKDQVEAALDAMLSSEGPYLLHVSIDELENVWPLVPPGASNAQMMEKLS